MTKCETSFEDFGMVIAPQPSHATTTFDVYQSADLAVEVYGSLGLVADEDKARASYAKSFMDLQTAILTETFIGGIDPVLVPDLMR